MDATALQQAHQNMLALLQAAHQKDPGAVEVVARGIADDGGSAEAMTVMAAFLCAGAELLARLSGMPDRVVLDRFRDLVGTHPEPVD